MRIKLLIFFCFFTCCFYRNLACECNEKPLLKEAYSKTDVILKGRVISIEQSMADLEDGEKYHIKKCRVLVTEIYKGKIKSKMIFVYTPSLGGGCGFDFKLDSEYLIYCTETNDKMLFYTDACTRTTIYDGNEATELKKLH